MFPSFTFFGKEIAMYAVMAMFGVFSSGIHGCVMADKKKYDYIDFIIFSLLLFVGVLIGGPILYALVNYNNFIIVFQNLDKITSINILAAVLARLFGGTVFYGGLLGALLAGYITVRIKPDFRKFIDIAAVNAPLFHFFGRIGCFLGGCCFGKPSKIGFTFTRSSLEAANHVNRFPIQLLESFFNLCLFFVLLFLYKKEKFKNNLLSVYLFLYAVGRFSIEFLRGDTHRGIWFFLSTSQIISIILIVSVILRYFFLTKRKTSPLIDNEFGK